jgi:hypothetical protein
MINGMQCKELFINFRIKLIVMKNKAIVLLGVICFVLLGVAAIKPVGSKERNLKVLPKDISQGALDTVMNQYCKALNVGCDFCHAESKTNKEDIDFASDDKPEKEIARIMMKMTAAINKDFFDYTLTYQAGETMAVSCMTCHDGFPRPELKHEKKE